MSDDKKPLDATFFAFRKREKRLVLTSAAIGYYALSLLISAAFLGLTWNYWLPVLDWYFDVLRAASSGIEPPAPPQDALLPVAPLYAFLLPLHLMLFAAFEAACLRWLVRREAGGGVLGLKLDADTWRVFAVYWIWLAYFIAAIALSALFYVLIALLGGLGDIARLAAMLVGALAPIGIAALLIWGGVVFAPAAATSVGRRKLTFWSTRKVSSPRFWPLLTSFLLVTIGYLVVSLAVSALVRIPLSAAIAPVMSEMLSGGDVSRVLGLLQEALLTPLMIAVLAVNVLVSWVLISVYYVTTFGINARAFEAAADAGEVERG